MVRIAIIRNRYNEVERYRTSNKVWNLRASHDTTTLDSVSNAQEYLDEAGKIWGISRTDEGQNYIDRLKLKCRASRPGAADYTDELKLENSNCVNTYIYVVLHRSSDGEITVTFSYHCLTTDGSLKEKVYEYLKLEAAQNLKGMLPKCVDFDYDFS
ncbi:unnamed protein product [Rotaria sp. Silwood2]|nr:unnamed protein product [Rotaria sp. Silwood2]CAF2844036.1 unnamed protein product [Rotaria sp. Silwood2]CAF3207400.1 unnamed protein product [Rotaria sp. Silwood2]CAF4132214.1 unnamed protein product [Rotaria sp. Silwood2]CAF4237291.1 unnamed protein product [Rotaria sp. Silwood2]